MKSAAFNLAFKVHRSEMPFPEGLLKAVEAEAQEDYIEALNSLAGETKYDINKLDEMIKEAKSGVASEEQKPKVDIEKLQEEREELRKKRSELKESIRTIEAQTSGLQPSIIPGINSIMLFIVGGIICLLLFLLEFLYIGLFSVLVTLVGVIYLLMHDLNAYNKQVNNIQKRKQRGRDEINKISFELDEVNKQIAELNQKIKEAEKEQASAEQSPDQKQGPEAPKAASEKEPSKKPDTANAPSPLTSVDDDLPPLIQ